MSFLVFALCITLVSGKRFPPTNFNVTLNITEAGLNNTAAVLEVPLLTQTSINPEFVLNSITKNKFVIGVSASILTGALEGCESLGFLQSGTYDKDAWALFSFSTSQRLRIQTKDSFFTSASEIISMIKNLTLVISNASECRRVPRGPWTVTWNLVMKGRSFSRTAGTYLDHDLDTVVPYNEAAKVCGSYAGYVR